MAQWLRLGAPIAGGPGSIPGQGTPCHMLSRRLKIPHAATENWCSQINKLKKKNRRGEGQGTEPPAGTRVRVQLSHTNA